MSKKVLVTGGCGYIGSHVCRQLSEQGYELVVLDNLSTGKADSLLHGERLIVGDLSDQALVDQVFQDHTFFAVLHFAASIVVPESVAQPARYYRNNTVNALSLFESCARHGVRNIIFSSTAAVYGDTTRPQVDEDTPLRPSNPYAASKAMSEQILQDIAKIHDLRFVILRYFNVAGADLQGRIGQKTPNATHLIKVACETALGRREKLEIFGTDYPTPDGTCIRDYIHVEDLASAHLSALNYLENKGESEILNCGYGRGISVKEIAEFVKKIAAVDFRVDYAPRRPGDIASIMAANGRIRNRLNWTPQFDSIDLIIQSALSWERSSHF